MMQKMSKLKLPKTYEIWVNSIPKRNKRVKKFLKNSCSSVNTENVHINYFNEEEINMRYYQREIMQIGNYCGYNFSIYKLRFPPKVFAQMLYSIQNSVKLELTLCNFNLSRSIDLKNSLQN